MYNLFTSFQNGTNNDDYDNSEIPTTTFPTSNLLTEDNLLEQLQPILVNSDPMECNNNLSVCMKLIVENLYTKYNEGSSNNYQMLSSFALELVTLNLFIKNYKLCIGKILGLLAALTDVKPVNDNEEYNEKLKFEVHSLREFLCIVLLLLLKMKNSPRLISEASDALDNIDTVELKQTMVELGLITVVANFITTHINSTGESNSPYLLLKFSSDVIFEYLYLSELLSDAEFESLTTKTKIIPTLINHLLANDDFNNYDINADDWDGENKLFVYEEFKLLLLINEQYLMKSYSSRETKNKVFDGLMRGDIEHSADNMSSPNNESINGFINLLIYYINREESQIIKILILKFLYLVFTTSYTAKLFYLNDLKILVDIFIRELNDLDYSDDLGDENRFLIITYLKVLYPLLMFSQLGELPNGYKNNAILEILKNVVLNSESGSDNLSANMDKTCKNAQEDTIAKLAMRCMSISWLRQRPNKTKSHNSILKNVNRGNISPSSSSSSLNSKLSFIGQRNELYQNANNSNESLDKTFTRIASVRTSLRSDYHMHTTSHNENQLSGTGGSKFSSAIENNHNIFLEHDLNSLTLKNNGSFSQSQLNSALAETNLLDIPNEYLHGDQLPSLTEPLDVDSSASSIKSNSSLAQKALKKKAPPPPPLKKINFGSRGASGLKNSCEFENSKAECTPPPPPPPRRRRLVEN